MIIAVLSDIHGNQAALKAVMNNILIQHPEVEAFVLLGDLIDYGPHSNEVIELITAIEIPIFCNIWGNHEQAVMTGEYSRFSSARGVACAKHTSDILDESARKYIDERMEHAGIQIFCIEEKKCMAVHGSLSDPYWKSITADDEISGYENYDYIFSGHSHLPHYFEKYYKADAPETRNRKKVIFINPGSVGQPRNINNKAQYVILDTNTENIQFVKVSYDILLEQRNFTNDVDEFYKERLERGI